MSVTRASKELDAPSILIRLRNVVILMLCSPLLSA
jgi:hypothetical protein